MENNDAVTPSGETQSLGARITNIFASPSEAFDSLQEEPTKTTFWLLPYLLFLVLAGVFTYLIYVNEPLRNQIFDMQARALDEQVEQGQMTREQADQFVERMEGTGLGIFMLFGLVPQIAMISAYFFGAALFLLLAAKIAWKAPLKYGKYLELYGLASWIGLLGYLVTMLMALGMNNIFAGPNLSMLVADYDPLSTGNRFLSAVNLFSIWQALVTGIGLSKILGKPSGAGIGLAFGLWVLWVAAGVPLGLVR